MLGLRPIAPPKAHAISSPTRMLLAQECRVAAAMLAMTPVWQVRAAEEGDVARSVVT